MSLFGRAVDLHDTLHYRLLRGELLTFRERLVRAVLHAWVCWLYR